MISLPIVIENGVKQSDVMEQFHHLRHSDQNEVSGRIFDEGFEEIFHEVNRAKEILQSGYHPPSG